jgi:hypothetical protein
MTSIITDLPTDAADRAFRARAAREEAALARITQNLAAIRAEHRAQRAAILTPDVERRLREHADGSRPRDGLVLPDDERFRRRAAERAFAHGLGVDLAALARLHADTRERMSLAVRPAPADGAVTALPDVQPGPSALASPWHGSWDAGTWWSSTAVGRTSWWADISHHLPSANRSGSHLRFRHSHSDSDDEVLAQHTSGYLLNYTMPFTGRLAMSFAATRAFGSFFVDNDDEPGWSECWTQAEEYGIADVYWDWNDPDPDSKSGSLLISGAMTEDTEAWIDIPGVFPGTSRGVQVTTDVTFPQGHTVLVFMATRQIILAWMNDVSTTVGVDGAWYLSFPQVRAV